MNNTIHLPNNHQMVKWALNLTMLAMLSLANCSCTLWKSAKQSVSYAPMLYIDSKELSDISGNSYLYLFNSESVLIFDTVIVSENLLLARNQLLTKNLWDGSYSLVAFSNVRAMAVPVVTRGVTRSEEVVVDSKSVEAHDSLRYHFSEHILERDRPETANLEANPRFYYLTVSVEGLEQLSKPLKNLSFRLFNLPSGIDHKGMPRTTNLGEYVPVLTEDEGGMLRSEEVLLLRFNDLSQTSFQILSDGKHVQTSLLKPSEFITFPSQTNVDIRVVFEPDRVSILVNDWFAGGTDLVEIGG